MAITIGDIKTLKEYFDGVMDRANHHAYDVNEIVLALIGGVIWRAEGDFWVREYDGAPANILWMEVNGKRYCFKFNHITGKIDCHENVHDGPVIKSFDNSTGIAEVKRFFVGL